MANMQSGQWTVEQRVWFLVCPKFFADLRATQDLRAARLAMAVAFSNESLLFKAFRGLAQGVIEPPPLTDPSDSKSHSYVSDSEAESSSDPGITDTLSRPYPRVLDGIHVDDMTGTEINFNEWLGSNFDRE